MIIDMTAGRVVGESENKKELKLLGYGGARGAGFYDPSPFEQQYYNNPETIFKFFDNRLEIKQGEKEITGNTYAIGFILPKNTMTSTTSTTMSIPLSEQPMIAMAEAVQRLIDEMAVANGIVLECLPTSFEDRLLLYCYPLLREIWTPEINLWNVHNGARYENFEHQGLHPAFKEKTMREAVKSATGSNGSKVIKEISRRLLIDKDQNIHTPINDISSRVVAQEYSEGDIPVVENLLYSTYVKKEVNANVFDEFWFLSKIFPSVDYVHQYLEKSTKVMKINVNFSEEIIGFFKERFTPKKTLNLLLKGFAWNEIRDTVTQYKEYNEYDKVPFKLRGKYKNGIEIPKNFKDIKELHDKISTQYNELKAEAKNRDIPYTPDEFKLHGYKKNNVELVLPSEGSVIVKWGKDMGHCIASYAERAANKKIVIMGVKVMGNLTYNIELKLDSKRDWEEKKRKFQKALADNTEPSFYKFTGDIDNMEPDYDIVTIPDGSEYGEIMTKPPEEYRVWRIAQFRGYRNCSPKQWVRDTVEKMLDEVFISSLVPDRTDQTKLEDHEPVQMMG